MLICFVSFADAASIGVSPSIIRLSRMLKEGYAETQVVVSTSIVEPLRAHLTREGEIADWMSFAPNQTEFIFSRDEPFGLNLIIQPPADTQNGNYTGILKMTTDELATVERGAGSSVIAQVALLIYVEVTGEEFIQCRAGAISTISAEVGDPIVFRATVNNDGNTRLRPKIILSILDQYQTQTLLTSTFLGSQVLPTRGKEILKEIENNLPVGQYFADIYIEDCDVTKLTTFDILEKGQFSDTGELIGIKTNNVVGVNELLPIVPIFRNTGARRELAQFKGEIRDLKTDKIVHVLESDSLEVAPGDTVEFRMFYTPDRSGDYQISGRVVYNNKITFEERSMTIKVAGSSENYSWLLFLMLYFIIGLVILILIGKIRKARKRRF